MPIQQKQELTKVLQQTEDYDLLLDQEGVMHDETGEFRTGYVVYNRMNEVRELETFFYPHALTAMRQLQEALDWHRNPENRGLDQLDEMFQFSSQETEDTNGGPKH